MLSPQTSTTSLGSLLRRNHKSSETLNQNHSQLHHSPMNSTNGISKDVSPASGPNLLNVTPYTLNTNTSKAKDFSITPSESGQSTPSKKSKDKDSSHLSLKRFLKKLKHAPSPEGSGTSHSNYSSTSTSHHKHGFKGLHSHSSSEMFKKYGTIGRLLGTGASGSVSLITSDTEPKKIYAVKKFRAKLPNELELDYKVKVKNEFKVGEMLKHQNLIHTFELIKETSSKFLADTEYFIVMEYAPYDFFNLVMSGLMDRKEIFCYFKQIIDGVGYLHENGLAHRDLKLDNCVVNAHGILKLIDFGSAVQFLKEINNRSATSVSGVEDGLDETHRLIRARGIVGSDPYLAPEVFEPSNFGYDPRLVDVWSIAIIFCCMILKRFPWKLPKVSDPSYKSFAGVEDDNVDKVTDKVKDLNVNPVTPPMSAPPPIPTEVTKAPVETPVAASSASVNLVPSQPNSNGLTEKVAQVPAAGGSSSKKLPPRGADRLLRILPTACRPLIKGMLTIDPSKRFFIHDIKSNDFYNSIEVCVQNIETDECTLAKDHVHHLVTEEDLQKLNEEKEKLKHIKEAGMA